MTTLSKFEYAIVIMGGGLTDQGTLPEHVVGRCRKALEISSALTSPLMIASSSFSLNLPPKLDRDKFVISESSAIAMWIIESGYKGDIVCEQQSHDTVGSIFFILNHYLPAFGVTQCIFVTSDFHIDRTSYIANTINDNIFSGRYDLKFESDQSGLENSDRRIRECRSLEMFKHCFAKRSSPEEFFKKLILEHTNYNIDFASSSRVGMEQGY